MKKPQLAAQLPASLKPSIGNVMKDIVSRLKKSAGRSLAESVSKWAAKPGWLTGQLLVAMPSMADPRFARAVIYICTHGPSGAMGLIVNRLFGEADFRMLLEQLNIEASAATPDIPVQFGGPVEMGRGFVLHSGDYLREGTTRIDDSVAVTATVEILQDLASGKGPERVMMALGYTGWSAGQLEEELKSNGWLTVPSDEAMIFDADLDSKWDRAMAKIGVSPAMLSGSAGHA
ncbi:MAG: YqgE/AlgH family protein [Alphaproteobacteria bacterium]|nr:YqgE/AlgH family protein [Alphaproteobacteria bacterium]